ncbi:methyltransferase [Solidesulfovibrio sp.]
MPLTQPINDFEPVESRLYAGIAAKGLLAALEMGLFKHLEAGDCDLGELAAKTGTVPSRLEPLLELLTAQGLLAKGQAYANTPTTSEYLVPGKPLYQGDGLALNAMFMKSLEQDLVGALRSNSESRNVSEACWGLEAVMEGTAAHALSGALQRVTRFVAGLPGFSDMRTLCDVGGNHGEFSMALLDANPDLRAVILDLPHVAEASLKRCRQRGYGDRIETRAFDLCTEAPDRAAYDLIVVSHVLYGVAEDLAPALGRLAAALRPGGWLVSHHFAPGGRASDVEACHELITRLAGYPTHFLSRQCLEQPMAASGLGEFTADLPRPPLGGGLILAGRKAA